jgi:hypothetical protein
MAEPGCMSKYQILEAVGRGVSAASGPTTAEIPPSFAPITPIIKQRNSHPPHYRY